ncbi:GNAT family N-acetyltransferase [Gilliamella sp. ESL0443]|uniref:GNAT family N-acetyltransferase n=1 Tax=Gilliamella sp. ESL0443 TaxID=2704655 RepID=UPI001C699529|nr:GNAT family N-acetyltransferase [Gilliamella sp. ESL0443]
MAWPNKCESDTANFLADCFNKHQRDETKTYVILNNNIPVGLLSFNHIDKSNKTAYIGYWLDSKAQGKGIITQAIQALTHYYAIKNLLNVLSLNVLSLI